MTNLALWLSLLGAGNGGDAVKLPDPGYNAPWPKNRGFHAGQTLPDIPLSDMNGKEVRFSKYLGKQYIIYVWASW